MTLPLAILAALIGLAAGYAWGERNTRREMGRWLLIERQERVRANREARQAEDQEKAAKRRIGEQVRAERLTRMFGWSE